jgi:hypothetical protein
MGGDASINPFNMWSKPDLVFSWAGWTYAVDAGTGAGRWRAKTNYPIQSGMTPTAGGIVLFGDIDGIEGGASLPPLLKRATSELTHHATLVVNVHSGWPGCSGPIRYGLIISLSSCSTMWQCQANWPAVVNFNRTRVISPFFSRLLTKANSAACPR